MVKRDQSQTFDEIGVITNAPIDGGKNGFAFVTLEDGRSVHLPAGVVRAAKIEHGDIGEQCRVRFTHLSDKRMTAFRAYVLRSGAGDDQSIVDLLTEIEDRVLLAYEMLESRGCVIPE